MNEQTKQMTAMLAVGLRIAMAFNGRVFMDADRQAIDDAEKMMKALSNRGYDLKEPS